MSDPSLAVPKGERMWMPTREDNKTEGVYIRMSRTVRAAPFFAGRPVSAERGLCSGIREQWEGCPGSGGRQRPDLHGVGADKYPARARLRVGVGDLHGKGCGCQRVSVCKINIQQAAQANEATGPLTAAGNGDFHVGSNIVYGR